MDQPFEAYSDEDVVGRVQALLDERLDVEALAQTVEHLNYSSQLGEKIRLAFVEVRKELTRVFQDLRSRINRTHSSLQATQQEVRDLILDVALLKRAAAAQGQVGVLERRKIERELVLELLPPSRPREGAGIQVAPVRADTPRRVDCENRLHLCKAACCRIFEAALTPQEVETDRYDWDTKRPYVLRRERVGCAHLQGGTCNCSVYYDRPQTCRNYTCEEDSRIWSDFANKVINPELAARLATLEVVTIPGFADRPAASAVATATVPGSPPPSVAPTAPPPSVQGLAAEVTIVAAPQGPPPPPPGPAGPPRADAPKVAPPNFDDLREITVARPSKLFSPPKGTTGNSDSAMLN